MWVGALVVGHALLVGLGIAMLPRHQLASEYSVLRHFLVDLEREVRVRMALRYRYGGVSCHETENRRRSSCS